MLGRENAMKLTAIVLSIITLFIVVQALWAQPANAPIFVTTATGDAISELHFKGEAVVVGLLTVIGFLGRDKMKRIDDKMTAYDKHLETCHTKDVNYGKMDQRLVNMEVHIRGVDQTNQWIGDCIVTMGAQLKIELPDRPYRIQP